MYKLMTAITLAGFIALGTVNAQDSTPEIEPVPPTETAPANEGTKVFAPKLKRLKGKMTLKWMPTPRTGISKGDLIARFEIEDADRQLSMASRPVTIAALKLTSLKEADRASSDAAQRDLKQAERTLTRAKEELEYFNKAGKVWKIRQSEIGLEGRNNSVKDQQEEMNQLDKLYKGNELGKQSADIVLNRARRRLAVTKENRDQAKKSHERLLKVVIPRQIEDKEYAVEKAQDGLDSAKFKAENGNIDLKIKILSTAASLEDAKLAVAELKQDILSLEVKAPSAGTISYFGTDNSVVKSGSAFAVIKEIG